MHLTCHSRLGNGWGASPSFHQHPIIAFIESQRIARGFAVFGIKNARRSARQDEFVVGGGVEKLIALGVASGFLNHDVAFCNDVVELALTFERLASGFLVAGDEEGVEMIGGNGGVSSAGGDSAFEVGAMLVVGVSETERSDGNRGHVSLGVGLHKDGGNGLAVALSGYGAVVAVELDGWSLHDVGVLPDAGVAGVGGDGGGAVRGHGARGDVNRGRRGEQGAAGLFAQIAVSALDVAFGDEVAGSAVHADSSRAGGERLVGDARRAGELQYVVGGCVAGAVGAGQVLAVVVGETSLLDDGVDPAGGAKGRINGLAGAGTVGLARSAADDAGVGRAMHGGQAAAIVKLGEQSLGGHDGTRAIVGGGENCDLAAS